MKFVWQPMLLATLLLNLVACDPQSVADRSFTTLAGDVRRPFVTGRVGALVCKGAFADLVPNSERIRRDGDISTVPGLRRTPSGVAALFTLSINETPAFNGSQFPGLAAANSASVANGYVVGSPVFIGSSAGGDPVDIVFTEEGLLLISLRGSNEVLAYAFTATGVPIFRARIPVVQRPGRIAVDNERNLAFVLNGDSTYQIIDLNEVDAAGVPDARPFSSPRRIALNNSAIRATDIAVGPGYLNPEKKDLYIAANTALYTIDIDIALGDKGAFAEPVRGVHPQQEFEAGVVANLRRGSPRADLLAIAPNGDVFWNDVAKGPIGPLYPDIGSAPANSLQDQGFVNTGGGIQRIQPGQVNDIVVTPDDASVLALTNREIFQFDRDLLGAQYKPLRVGGSRMKVDPAERFILVTDPGSNTVHIVRLEPNGLISYNGPSDDIRVGACVSPVVAAMAPETIRYSLTGAQPTTEDDSTAVSP